ncbi:aspartate aminotransferase family protein [Francisella sp. Scap27]|uniref:pyridoxal phosphate-dependent decarboxylase family protein n=1 Tax=Francisella sp. Scap27 TaxID=2589986 RepID=UPI0015BD12AF|nr:aspartate aminotransferase family protein [Francisella sp. Scap27]QLE78447.1 aspartate aminotransferase family protein [Francisella sp. Scap27]
MNLNLDKYFLNSSGKSIETYTLDMHKALNNISKFLHSNGVYSGKTAAELEQEVQSFQIGEKSQSIETLLENQFKAVLENSLNINSPKSMAHLHCPVMQPSLIAELFISVLNQSMDSWDQSPIATYIEQNTINWLNSLIYEREDVTDGVFTSGGTQSNLMGLLLARDNYCNHQLNHNVSKSGLPKEASKFRVLCTKKTHFSVHKSLSLLGLGMNCIETVNTDDNLQLDTDDLLSRIQNLIDNNLIPLCVVTTVGDTDFGCIDNIAQIAKIAQAHDIWLHVDAAVGGALLLSNNHKQRLKGIEFADSVTIDFHKLFFQPISCGAFLCKDKSLFSLINYHADYLNPDQDGFDALNLVDKSIQTTRRFDALKLCMALKCCGTKNFAKWIDHILEITTETIKLIGSDKYLELAFQENQHLNNSLNTAVFRFNDGSTSRETLNIINSKIHKSMFLSGEFAIAQTKVNKETFLKITFVNPSVTLDLVSDCLDKIKKQGQFIENQVEEGCNDSACL